MNKKIANEIAIGMVISLSIIIGLIFWQSQKQAYRNDYRKAEIVQQPLIYSFYNNIKKDNMQFAENKNSETIIRKICEKFPVNKKIQTWVDNEGVAKFFQINNEISSDDEIFYLLDLNGEEILKIGGVRSAPGVWEKYNELIKNLTLVDSRECEK